MRSPEIIIVGAGMTGILLTIKLREAGINKITVLEKAEKVGGTWRENRYPGVACDVPAHMYTYSFEHNPEWSDFFAKGAEIQQYFEHVADKYKVHEHIKFQQEVSQAERINGRWQVNCKSGERYEADFLIHATGILHHISLPDIAGIDSFKGEMFHTARWNQDIDFKGKRVGVIGTGSTAAQFIPELVNAGAEVSIFQRTPQWLLSLGSKQYSEADKAKMRRNPKIIQRIRKQAELGLEHIFTKAVTGQKLQGALLSWACKRYLRKSIKDPVLREKLTPNYKVGCKRVIINNTFYDAIQKPNANLICEGIDCINECGIKTRDGQQHDFDVIVLSTGFKPFNFMRPMELLGQDGLHIDSAWKDKINCYRSLLVPKFPNMFLMLGPYTPIGNFSVIAMSEVQTNYILKLIKDWQKEKFDEFDVKDSAVDTFNQRMKAGMKKTTWVGGCQSWYQDADGDPILWPFTWKQWCQEMDQIDYQDLSLSKGA
ncbi:MAG: NAD(P)/FAD-dependent oxidoreductase [Cellvibrionaceae bacterium]|nr:NAD(P)/FAD-dependent oxidoreductase [Cellvibrionaceae bacterium]